MALIAGMAPDTVFSLNKEKEKDYLKSKNRTRAVRFVNETRVHYTTRELTAR